MSNSLSLHAPLLAALLLSSPHTAASLPAPQKTPLDSRSQTMSDATVALQSAESLAKAGRYPEAIGLYRHALQLDPRTEAAQLGLADTYRRVHNYDQARAVLQAARRHHPKSSAILTALGSLEIEAESWDAAIEALRLAVTLSPEDTNARSLLGAAYLGKGDKPVALAQFAKILAQQPENQLAHFQRAQIYADSDENEKALADAEKVFAARPEYLPGRTLLAKILLRLKKCERAVEVLRPRENPPQLDTQSLFLLANAYECAGQVDLAKNARDEFAAASQNDRRQAENEVQSKHLYEQANELARENRFGEALDLLRQALDKNPKNAFAYSQQAKIYFSTQQFDQARQAIVQALAVEPYQPDFLYVQGIIEEKEGNPDAALATFEKVVQINPKEADAYFEIGQIWMQKQNRARALDAFGKAASLAPDDPDYRRALEAARTPSP
jgi:tetratricopeptide (TPR) repeat protein